MNWYHLPKWIICTQKSSASKVEHLTRQKIVTYGETADKYSGIDIYCMPEFFANSNGIYPEFTFYSNESSAPRCRCYHRTHPSIVYAVYKGWMEFQRETESEIEKEKKGERNRYNYTHTQREQQTHAHTHKDTHTHTHTYIYIYIYMGQLSWRSG